MSAGYFARKRYDDVAARQVSTLPYDLYTGGYVNSGKCLARVGGGRATVRGAVPAGDLTYRTEVESMLLNLDIPDSRFIQPHVLVEKDKRMKAFLSTNASRVDRVQQCGSDMDERSTRLDLPGYLYRAPPINRYGFPLLTNEQVTFYGISNTDQVNNNRTGVNTRLVLKDSLRPKTTVKASA